MKQGLGLALGAALLFAGVAVRADMREETTTEKTTSYRGTVSEFAPGSSTIILKSDSGAPMRYQVNEKTTFVDAQGNVVSRETIQNQPVTVFTDPAGGSTIVSRVVVDRSGGGGTTTRKETTVEKRTE